MSSEATSTIPQREAESSATTGSETKVVVGSANGMSEAAKATSEANITAADPNASAVPLPKPGDDSAIADANVDIKAADLAEGAVSGATVIAPDTSSTPASTKKKDPKRRSSGVPEHKSKKGGKKREIVLNLDCEPGDYFFARMKGHPEWPAIICDEEMLPEVIMGSRPVTARRADGSYRADFADGGKNAKERTYPVMFLGTNEFAWMPNTDLRKLTAEDVKDPENMKGMKKGLLEAYKIAAEFHDLDHYKGILFSFENARAEEEKKYQEKLAKDEAKAARKAEKAETKEKKKRKSTGAVEDEMDVDGQEEPTPKSSKKRKATGTDDNEKPAKTPKLKITNPKAAGDSAKSKKTKTPKAKPAKEAPAMSESDRLEKKEKSVLYLRHKLQKGFLQTTAPQESEMDVMAQHFDKLEQYKELEVNIIRKTKIHKVLKEILKLNSVPLEEKFGFQKRSNELLQHWNKILSVEAGASTNGSKTEDEKNGSKAESSKGESKAEGVTSTTEASAEKDTTSTDAKDEASNGDVTMTEEKKDEKPAAVDEDDTSAPATAGESESKTVEASA